MKKIITFLFLFLSIAIKAQNSCPNCNFEVQSIYVSDNGNIVAVINADSDCVLNVEDLEISYDGTPLSIIANSWTVSEDTYTFEFYSADIPCLTFNNFTDYSFTYAGECEVAYSTIYSTNYANSPECPFTYTICPGETASLFAIGAIGPPPDAFGYSGTVTWSPNTNLTCSNYCLFASASPLETTLYTVSIFEYGQYKTAYVLVEVADCGTSQDVGLEGMMTEEDFLFGGEKEVKVMLNNFGAGTLETAEINWSVNGVMQPAVIFDEIVLPMGHRTEVVLGNYTFMEDVNYELSFWTSNPNGLTDSNPGNDLINTTLFIPDIGINPTDFENADIVELICPNDTINLAYPNIPHTYCPWSPTGFTTMENISWIPNDQVLYNDGNTYVVSPNESTLYNYTADYELNSCTLEPPVSNPGGPGGGASGPSVIDLSGSVYVIVDECIESSCGDPLELDWLQQIIANVESFSLPCTQTTIRYYTKHGEDFYTVSTAASIGEGCPTFMNNVSTYDCAGNIVCPYNCGGTYAEGIKIYTNSEPYCEAYSGKIFLENCDNGEGYFFIETDNGLIFDPYFSEGLEFDYFDGQLVEFDYVKADFPSPCSNAIAINLTCIREEPRILKVKVLLEGAHNENLNYDEMDTHLVDGDLLPESQPYGLAPWNQLSMETLPDHDRLSRQVDWVIIELRSGTPDFINAQTSVIASMVGLVDRDGYVNDIPNNRLEVTGLVEGEAYYVVVRHRNHLDVISGEPIIAEGVDLFYDFTTSVDQAFGPEQLKEMPDGKFAMHSGDYNGDGIIQSTDYDVWFAEPAAVNVYDQADGNLDGVIQSTDYDEWTKNKAKVGCIEIRYE